MKRVPLTIFRLLDQVGGQQTGYENVLNTKIQWNEIPASEPVPLDARLFVKVRAKSTAAWSAWLREGYPELPEQNVELPGALIVLKIVRNNSDYWFAISFGSGHHLLREDAINRRWGLRTALNLLYNPDQPSEMIRRVDAKTLSTNRMLVARQAARLDAIDKFGVDIRRDLLGAVVGAPRDKSKWGRIVCGRDAVHVGVKVQLSELAELCDEIENVWEQQHYEQRFKWIDHIVPVRDAAIRANLMGLLLNKIKGKITADLNMCPPDLISWDGVSFEYVGVGRQPAGSLDISDYITFLEQAKTKKGASNKLLDLDEHMLSKSHKVVASRNGAELGTWGMLRCIDGEFKCGGQRYVLSNGEFYTVSDSFVAEIKTSLRELVSIKSTFPSKNAGEREDEYIVRVCSVDPTRILMDKKEEKAADMSTEVEVCDIYEKGKRFVHLKRKSRSSTLSHLFNQAFVSGDLLVRHQSFRQVAFDRIFAEENVKFVGSTTPAAQHFAGTELSSASYSASGVRVCLGILTNWKTPNEWIEEIPFFSLVTFSRIAEDLKALTYSIEFEPIHSPDD